VFTLLCNKNIYKQLQAMFYFRLHYGLIVKILFKNCQNKTLNKIFIITNVSTDKVVFVKNKQAFRLSNTQHVNQ